MLMNDFGPGSIDGRLSNVVGARETVRGVGYRLGPLG
jgi:hypothetical protein